MKKLCIILVLSFLASGCATYKIQQNKGDSSGFVVSRYKKVIPEYTIGADGSYPDKVKAEERFDRRRKQVEYYYKRMGFIENRFRQLFVEPPLMFVRLVGGIFRLPFIAVSDYKYNHNPQYKEKMDRLDNDKYEAEKARVKRLKDELSEYIKEDLNIETSSHPLIESQPAMEKPVIDQATAQHERELAVVPVAAPETASASGSTIQEAASLESVPAAKAVMEPASIEKPAVQEKVLAIEEGLNKASNEIRADPVAVIIAKPLIGSSPLKVSFSGKKSSSPNGRIVAYSWDFGDGDKSNLPNPSNTYWSTTYGVRDYTAILTVTDSKGLASSSSITVQVVNK